MNDACKRLEAFLKPYSHVHGASTLMPGLTLADLRTVLDALSEMREAMVKARALIGLAGQKEELNPAAREANGNKAWHLLDNVLDNSGYISPDEAWQDAALLERGRNKK